jgi:hypothetical protein
VQIEQWTLEKLLVALVGYGRKCKTCSNETLTTKQQNSKPKQQQKPVLPTALQLPNTKQRKYRPLSSSIEKDRFPKAN